MNNRYLWADVIRSLAIYLVVLNHNFHFQTTTTTYTFISVVFFTIIRTAIPLFVMLSGALLLGKKESLTSFFKKRIVRVGIPWIVWTLLFMLFNQYMHTQTINSFKEFKAVFIQTFFTQLWFLPMIAGIYLLTPLWRSVVQNTTRQTLLYIILVWFFFVSLIPFLVESITFPFNTFGFFPQAISYSMYFILGYYLTTMKRHIPLLYTSIIFCIGVLWTYFYFQIGNTIDKTFHFLAPNIIFCSISLYLILIYIFRKKNVLAQPYIKVIQKMSVASLSIYIIHQPLMQLVAPFLRPLTLQLNHLNILLTIIIVGTGHFLITFALVYFLQKIPKTKLIFP